MKLCGSELFIVRSVCDVYIAEEFTHLRHILALAQNPRDKFKLCNILPALARFGCINSIAHKIKPCNTNALFVYGIIVKRVIICNMCHTDDGIVVVVSALKAKIKRIIAGCNRDAVTVRKFIIKSSAKIKILCFVSCGCAHINLSFCNSIRNI